MSIHCSKKPHPHCAMYFCDMICVMVRLAASGTMVGLARKVAFSAGVICVGVAPSSEFRAFTKSIWDEIPFVYAVSASGLFPCRKAASAFTNCSWEYVTIGYFALSENRYRPGAFAGC